MNQRHFIFYVESQAGHPVCVVSSASPRPGQRDMVWQKLENGEFVEGAMPIVFLDPDLDTPEAREEIKAHLLFAAVKNEVPPTGAFKQQ